MCQQRMRQVWRQIRGGARPTIQAAIPRAGRRDEVTARGAHINTGGQFTSRVADQSTGSIREDVMAAAGGGGAAPSLLAVEAQCRKGSRAVRVFNIAVDDHQPAGSAGHSDACLRPTPPPLTDALRFGAGLFETAPGIGSLIGAAGKYMPSAGGICKCGGQDLISVWGSPGM